MGKVLPPLTCELLQFDLQNCDVVNQLCKGDGRHQG